MHALGLVFPIPTFREHVAKLVHVDCTLIQIGIQLFERLKSRAALPRPYARRVGIAV